MLRIILLFSLFTYQGLAKQHFEEITPSIVYREVLKIEQDVELIKKHLGLTKIKKATPVFANLLPRHSWQKVYLIQLKINLFREQRGFPTLAANNLHPVKKLPPGVVYEQTQRLLTEISLLKRRLEIKKKVRIPPLVPGKNSIDVFNKLNQISLQWDIINRSEISPSEVYAELKRVNEDINSILKFLHIQDSAFPPAKKENVIPSDSLASSFILLEEIHRLQQLAGIDRIDLSVFSNKKQVLPSDVLNMVILILAELQTIKAHLGLYHQLTPPTEKHSQKTPAEVDQFLGYLANKLRLIRSLN